MDVDLHLRKLFDKQQIIVDGMAKRTILHAGRRFGKTTLAADVATNDLIDKRRVLYAVPTQEQVEKFWFECKLNLAPLIDSGALYKHEGRHILEFPGTEYRIRAKTAWNADTLRGDYADRLIMDEYQLMKKDAWSLVGAPMLLDNDGDALFIYTGKKGKYHAKDLKKRALADTSGRWAVFRYSSHDNPTLSRDALAEITSDMTYLGYQLEIEAVDLEDDPNALWKREDISENRHVGKLPPLVRVAVGVDPPGTADGAECGIVAGGVAYRGGTLHCYILDDRSLRGSPATWGAQVVTVYNDREADRVIGEVNHGGDMVERVIQTADGAGPISFKAVRASRGKAIRAEPVAALYEKGRIHHVGEFGELESQMCTWVPGDESPDRLDALVWLVWFLMIAGKKKPVRAF